MKYLYLIIGVVAIIEVLYHSINSPNQAGNILGFEIPFIPFILMNGLLGSYFLYRFFSISKAQRMK